MGSRILRIGAFAAVGMIGAMCVLLLSIYAILVTETGRTHLVAFLNSQWHTPEGNRFSIRRLDVDFPNHVLIEGVAVQDKEGEWFRLDSAGISWRPAKLLDGDFHITDLELSGLHVERTPFQEPRHTTTASGGISLPLRIAIDRFSLKEASLGEPVLGETVEFRASGGTTMETDGLVRTTVDLDRTDGMTGHARLEAEFQPQSNRLGIRFAWQEPRSGTVARALDLPDLPSLSIRIRGDGPLNDWHGGLQARAGDLASLDMKIELDVVNRSTLNIEGHADLSRLFDEPLRSLLADRVTFDAAAAFTDDEIVLQQGIIANPLGTVESSGGLRDGHANLKLALTLTPRGIDALNGTIAPLSTTGLRLDAELAGSLMQPAISVDVTADSVTIEDLSASHFKGKFEIAFQQPYSHPEANPRIRAEGQLTGIRLDPPDLQALIGNRIAWHAESVLNLKTMMIDIQRAAISTAVGRLSGSGRVDAGGRECDLKVTAGLKDLAILSPLIHQPVTGSATFESLIRSSDVTQGFNAEVAGKLDDLSLDNPFTDKLLGPQITIAGTLFLNAVDGWTIRDLNVRGALAELTGSVSVPGDTREINGSYHLKVARLADLSDVVKIPLTGRLDVVGELGGTLDAPALSNRISSPALAIDSVDLGSLDARLQVAGLPDNPHGHAAVSIRGGRHGDARIETDFAFLDTGPIQLSRLTVESKGTKIDGDLMVPLKAGPVIGSLSGRIASLAEWSEWIGRRVTGMATVGIVLSEEDTFQTAEVTVDGNGLTIAVTEEEIANIDSLSASAKITRLPELPTSRISLAVKGAKLFDASISESSVICQINGINRADIRAKITGDLYGPFNADLDGSYSRDGERIEWVLSGLDAMIKGQRMALEKPARFTLGPGTMSVADLSLAAGDARILAAGRVTEDDIDGVLEVTNFPLAAADIVLPHTALSGLVSGSARLGGARTSPVGRFTVEAANVLTTTSLVRDVPATAALITGEWRDSRIKFTGELHGLTENSVTLEANLPLRLDPATLAVKLPRDEEIKGKIKWKGALDPIWNLLAGGDDRFKGEGDLSLDLAGNLNAPRVGGYFELIRGRYDNVNTGTTISDMALRIEGDRERLVLKQFAAGDGGSGRIEGHGAIELNPAKNFPFDIQVDFKETLLAARDDLSARASGKLTFNGSLADALLSGEIITENVECLLAGNLPPEVVELDVEEINGPNGPPFKNKNRNGGGTDPNFVNLDLQIAVPRRVFVKGMGLDSEWKGALRVVGPANAYMVVGMLEPVGGGFTLLGKTFGLRHGAVRFPGTQEIDPLFNLTAEYKAQDLTAIVALTGSASHPKITITSRPPLPQPEIVSRVLFGTDAESLTPAQSIQVASSIATFGNMGGVGNIMETMRRSLGIDVFKFDSGKTDPSETRISIGKYLTNGLYIEMEQGTKGDSRTATTVEVDVLSNVKVEGGTTEQGGGKMGVKWKWDY